MAELVALWAGLVVMVIVFITGGILISQLGDAVCGVGGNEMPVTQFICEKLHNGTYHNCSLPDCDWYCTTKDNTTVIDISDDVKKWSRF